MSEGALSLEQIGFRPFFAEQFARLDPGLAPARITIAHGESYVAWTQAGVEKAMIVGRRLADWQTAADRPQVGDWVAGNRSPELGAFLIEHRLERQTCLVRKGAADRTQLQVIAANVDVVGIVSALGDGHSAKHQRWLIDEARIQRYLGAVAQSGARPLLIINKSDLHPDPAGVAERLAASFAGVPVVTLSGGQSVGLERLDPWLAPGETLVLVGMSGVGKSTLVNSLLGRAAQRVGAVRGGDDRGRHTTTHREIFALSSGALLIDTPGMREMSLWTDEPDAATSSRTGDDRKRPWRRPRGR